MSRAAFAWRLGLLAVASWLRLHDLGHWSLDGDELYSWYDVQLMLEGESWPHGARSHPLGYVAMAAAVALGGLSEASLRIVPALSGVAVVALLLWLRRDVVPTLVSVVAGGLAAISPWLVYQSQTARFYAPLLLFASLASLWALRAPGGAVEPLSQPGPGPCCAILPPCCWDRPCSSRTCVGPCPGAVC